MTKGSGYIREGTCGIAAPFVLDVWLFRYRKTNKRLSGSKTFYGILHDSE